jgi:NAD-dependent SIR2 family protein deacetylase
MKAGIRPDLLAELHGSFARLRYSRCEVTVDMPLAVLQPAKLVIINQGETPFDRVTNLMFHERIDDVLPRAVRREAKKLLLRKQS